MKRLYGISSIVVFFFLIAGCTTLTADGENVRVINDADKVQNCELKGKIHSVGLGNALLRARNAAGREWNADTLLISGAGDNLEALAYICNE